MTRELPAVDFLGLRLAAITPDELIRWIVERTTDCAPCEHPAIVSYLNAHTSNVAASDASFRAALSRADVVYADGMGVVWGARRLGRPVPERVNAGDFLGRFQWAAHSHGIRVALVGSDAATVSACARHWRGKIPGFEFACVHHGHFARGGPEEAQLLANLREARADVVLAGMGSPRQELWATECGPQTGARVIWCVGALFEYYADRRRAPVWMRRAGLEWLFRLALEPGRLGKRYLWGNILFAMRVLRAR